MASSNYSDWVICLHTVIWFQVFQSKTCNLQKFIWFQVNNNNNNNNNIHWELYKKFKFNQTNKWYMHNAASVLENETHKHLWDFYIPTDHLISAWRPDLIIINKKENLQNCGLCCPDWPQNKIESKWKEG